MKNILIHTVIPAISFFLGVVFCLKIQDSIQVPQHDPTTEHVSPMERGYSSDAGDYYYSDETPESYEDGDYHYSDETPESYEEYDYEESKENLEVI